MSETVNTGTAKKEAIVADLLSRYKSHGYLYAERLEEVPETIGHYALYDGEDPKGCGTARNMRQAVAGCSWYGRCACRIILYLPADEDGSAAAWLEGDMKKYRAIARRRKGKAN